MPERMNEQLQVRIVQRVRQFLGVEEECSASELYSKLHEYRNQMHPDRFTDGARKEHAETKFKEAQNLLPELCRFIQDEVLRRTPTDLALYKPVYEHVFTQNALDAASKEIDDLKQQLEWRKHEMDSIKEQLADRKKQEFDAERTRLESLYRPSGRSWASLGITLLLSGALAVMTKIEEVSAKLKKYSPVDDEVLNTALFLAFLTILVLMVKRLIENSIMKRRVREVCSAKAPIDFLKHVSEETSTGEPEYFTEYQVFEFLHGPKRWWKSALSLLGFVHYQIETVDQLKTFFISNLLHKELVTISHAEGLNRSFSIRKKRGEWI